MVLLALEYPRPGKKKVARLRVCFCVEKCQNLLVLFSLTESISPLNSPCGWYSRSS